MCLPTLLLDHFHRSEHILFFPLPHHLTCDLSPDYFFHGRHLSQPHVASLTLLYLILNLIIVNLTMIDFDKVLGQ